MPNDFLKFYREGIRKNTHFRASDVQEVIWFFEKREAQYQETVNKLVNKK